MNSLTRKLFLGFSLIFSLAMPGKVLWGRVPPEAVAHVTISVYNGAGVPGGTLRQAEEEGSRVLRQAGIEVNWLNCGLPPSPEETGACQEAVFPAHLHLRIVPRSHGLKEGALGISFLSADGSGCQADLFYEPMERLHNSNDANLASLLGHVAAHEVGHLLLGTNSHGPAGIMQAHWVGDEIGAAKLGRLYFSGRESQKMRETLSLRVESARLAPHLAPPQR